MLDFKIFFFFFKYRINFKDQFATHLTEETIDKLYNSTDKIINASKFKRLIFTIDSNAFKDILFQNSLLTIDFSNNMIQELGQDLFINLISLKKLICQKIS